MVQGFDWRGFDIILKILLFLTIFYLLLIIFYNWKFGLLMLMINSLSFIVIENISKPPANNPIAYLNWNTRQTKRRPKLLCIGDSLLHGNISSTITPQIPIKLSKILGMELPNYDKLFNDPIWVINGGQNYITTHTILYERLTQYMKVYPDYIVLMIGTNDIISMCNNLYNNQQHL